MSTSNVSWG